jgi:selenocysteine-specific elongation factor
VRTVGGGEILDPLPRKHKRHTAAILAELDALKNGSDVERVSAIIHRAGLAGITVPLLTVRTGIHPNQIGRILQDLFSRKEAVLSDREAQRVVASTAYRNLQEKIGSETTAYHEKFPLKAGMSKEELRTTLGDFIDPKLFNLALRDLEKAGKIAVDKEAIKLPDHRVNLRGDLEALREQISRIYLDAGLTPPTAKEIMEKLAGRTREAGNVLRVMLNEGALIKVDEDLYFHGDSLKKLREDYRDLLLRDGKATPATFKDLTGLSRKFIIPLMEYFDASKLTIRVGDHRVLRDREAK